MSNNNSFQVFKGGWAETQNSILTENQGGVDANSFSFFMKPDGMVAFVLHAGLVEEHPLTIAWDVFTIQPAVNSFSVTNEDTSAFGIFFKDDGTKMFIAGDANKKLFEYDLSAWNISTAVFNSVTLDLSAVPAFDSVVNCVFSTTGNIVFITTGASVFSYILNNNWDAGSNTIAPTTFTPSSNVVDSIAFKPEGDKMYIGNVLTDTVTEFDLSSPFIIVGAVDTGKTLDVTPQGIDPKDIFWKSNGTEFFVLGSGTNDITKYHLESDWNISTASFFANDLSVNEVPRTIFWRPDGLKMFEMDSSTDLITAYDGTTPFNTSTLTQLVNTFDVSNQETNPQGMFWSSDGSFLFIIGINARTVFKYSTSIPFSIEPADINSTPVDTFLVDTQFFASGIWFNRDGTIMLISETADPKQIHQYNLSAPYVLPADETPANFILDLDEITDPVGINPRDLFLKPDGLQMFLPDNINDTVARYTIPTPFGSPSNPFDISKAKFADTLDLTFFSNNLQGISMSPDGKKLFVCDIMFDKILTFNTP